MGAAIYNITIEQGADFSLNVTWNGVVVTGYTGICQVRTDHSATLLLSLTVTVTNGPGGVFTLSAPASTTAALAPFVASYDLLVTSPGGQKTRLLEGSARLEPAISQ